MRRSLGLASTLAVLLILASCGSDSLLLSRGGQAPEIQIVSLTDGQLVQAGSQIPVALSSRSVTTPGELEIEATLTSPGGRVIWRSGRLASAGLNEQTPLTLPDIPAGQYVLEVVAYSGGVQAGRKTSTFFVAPGTYTIGGITSFPPVLTAGSTVLLRAELGLPAEADAWLRWSWKGKSFARGLASAGSAEALWTAPAEEGVYSIFLELFPSAPPAGTDFPFASQIVQSTDLYVTSGTRVARGDLSPAQSYLVLLHMQGNLDDAAAAGRRQPRPAASPVGSPRVERVGDGFGYRLDGRSGISIPWFVLPLEDGALAPFTVSIGLAASASETGGRIFSTAAADGAFLLEISLDPATRAPRCVLSTGQGAALEVPWTGPALPADTRVLLSLSVQPEGKSLEAAWFLDGNPVSRAGAEFEPAAIRQEGRSVLGGEGGLVGVIDEFGVYVRDGQGRPSTDPELFSRSARGTYGESLVLAEGFDGPFLPDGFTGPGLEAVSGSLAVAAGAAIAFPPLARGAEAVRFQLTLAQPGAGSMLLDISWGASGATVLSVPIAPDAGSIVFTIGQDAQSIITRAGTAAQAEKIPPAADAGAPLVLRLSQPRDAKAALLLESVLAFRVKP
jgi:hypothetical protein